MATENSFSRIEELFRIRRVKQGGMAKASYRHYHDGYEIYYPIAGEITYFINNKSYRVKRGEVVLIGPYDLHRTIYSSIAERVLISFQKEFIDKLLQSIENTDLPAVFQHEENIISLNFQTQKRIESIFDSLLYESNNKDINGYNLTKLLLVELLIILSREAYSIDNIGQVKKDHHRQLDPMMAKANDIAAYISENYARPLSLERLSQEFEISPFYLTRIFKKHTGFTVIEYINHVRVRQAAKLLKLPGAKVEDTARNTGFSSAIYFGKVFKKIMGASPVKYRKTQHLR